MTDLSDYFVKGRKPTDDEIGDYILDKWDGLTRYFHSDWYRYRDGYWQRQTANSIARDLWKVLKDLKLYSVKPSANKVSAVESYLQAFLYVDDEQIDPQNEYINVKNGLYNLLTDELEPHTPDLYFTSQLGFAYDPEAEAPIFRDFLSQVLIHPDGSTDEQLQTLLYEAMGYSLTSRTDFRTSFWLVGATASGKSVLLNIITALAGESHISIDLDELNQNAYQLADIAGKRVVSFSEPRANSVLADNHYKRLVSQDTITARRIFGSPFRFKAVAKLWGAMNDTPRVIDRSDAVFNRIQIFPFHRTVPPDQRDTRLYEKLEAELPGIFNLALGGLKRLRFFGEFTRAAQSIAALNEYRYENDIERLFILERCDRDENSSLMGQELYDAYSTWCRRNGSQAKSHIKVSKDWQRLGLVRKRTNKGTEYSGVILKPEKISGGF